jgi:hypothetical protein
MVGQISVSRVLHAIAAPRPRLGPRYVAGRRSGLQWSGLQWSGLRRSGPPVVGLRRSGPQWWASGARAPRLSVQHRNVGGFWSFSGADPRCRTKEGRNWPAARRIPQRGERRAPGRPDHRVTKCIHAQQAAHWAEPVSPSGPGAFSAVGAFWHWVPAGCPQSFAANLPQTFSGGIRRPGSAFHGAGRPRRDKASIELFQPALGAAKGRRCSHGAAEVLQVRGRRPPCQIRTGQRPSPLTEIWGGCPDAGSAVSHRTPQGQRPRFRRGRAAGRRRGGCRRDRRTRRTPRGRPGRSAGRSCLRRPPPRRGRLGRRRP